MTDRYYDITLECGCMISLDGGGGLIPCCYGCGCGKKMDALGYVHCGDEITENGVPQGKIFKCKECIEQEKKCAKAWEKYLKSKERKEHIKEIIRRNL